MKAPRTTPETADTPTALKKSLTTPLLYLFILGDVIGAGVTSLLGDPAAPLPTGLWMGRLLESTVLTSTLD